VQIGKDLLGRDVLTAYAPVAPLGWLVFAELPVDEANAPLYQALERSGVLLLAGLALAFLAALFSARMPFPRIPWADIVSAMSRRLGRAK
jgi:hypothetical protein